MPLAEGLGASPGTSLLIPGSPGIISQHFPASPSISHYVPASPGTSQPLLGCQGQRSLQPSNGMTPRHLHSFWRLFVCMVQGGGCFLGG